MTRLCDKRAPILCGFLIHLTSNQGRAESACEERFPGNQNRATELGFQGFHQPDVFSSSAGDGHIRLDLQFAYQGKYAARDCLVDSSHKVRHGLSAGQLRGDLLFGEDRAHVADQRRPLRCQRDLSQFFKGNAEGFRNNFEETTRAGGAFVIHDEIDNFAVFYPYAFAVLPPDVDHGAGGGKEAGQSLCMTGNFGNLPVGKWHIDSAVSGCDDVCHIAECDARPIQGLLHHPVCQLPVLRSRGPYQSNFLAAAHNDHLGHRRPDVHTGEIVFISVHFHDHKPANHVGRGFSPYLTLWSD